MASEALNGHAMPSVTIEEVKVDIEASEASTEEKAEPEANGDESTGNVYAKIACSLERSHHVVYNNV